jgi:glutamine amidotransferase
MLKKIGADASISSKISDIEKADKLILPGVGAFDTGIKNLNDLGLMSVLEKKVILEKTPILGICLGMQLFAKKSEEGKLRGLNWVNAEVKKFKFSRDSNLKIPHMGWNTILLKKQDPLFDNIDERIRFYFVHSYHIVCEKEDDVLSVTNYGYDFVSSVRKENIVGVQFHPEKSHKYGLKLLENFVKFY